MQKRFSATEQLARRVHLLAMASSRKRPLAMASAWRARKWYSLRRVVLLARRAMKRLTREASQLTCHGELRQTKAGIIISGLTIFTAIIRSSSKQALKREPKILIHGTIPNTPLIE
ncbi:hypothetical protein MTR_1g052615 [Medicago truncatula]|uniref:Uncharacterized protein n=1 Tax=Medicago truncatula TaxID=3880 RepID=A0A072VJ03_MEDTR|nr:hypothetical protein MTR_1g052615 [Medicago truncatula]